jgi:hypothetical protein
MIYLELNYTNLKTTRFNLSLDLAVFIGAKRYGSKEQRSLNCLFLDKR